VILTANRSGLAFQTLILELRYPVKRAVEKPLD